MNQRAFSVKPRQPNTPNVQMQNTPFTRKKHYKNATKLLVTTLMGIITLAFAGQGVVALQQAQAVEALMWRRTGGIAGLCDELTVYVTGEVQLASCKGGESVVTHQRRLPIDQLKQLYTWFDRYRAWEIVEHDPYIDGFTFHTVFVGTGTAEPTPEEKQEITAFAATLFEKASAPEAASYQAIAVGSTLSGTIKGATQEFFSYHGYQVDVPANTSHLAIQVDSQGHDLDLAVKFGSELSSWDEAEVDFSDFTEGTNPSYRVSNPPAGPLYFEVINPVTGKPGSYSVTITTGATGAEAEITSTPEPHAPPPGDVPEPPPPGELPPSKAPQPLVPEHFPETMQSFQSPLSVSIPDGWRVEESITLSSPDGSTNVIVSSEPLDVPTTTQAYAETVEDRLANFPDYQELELVEAQVFGRRTGHMRHFEWTPDGAERITQIQLYYTENGRAFTATATTTTADFEELETQLRQLLDGIHIEPQRTSPDHPQGETSQRTEGPTINGGAYAIAYFRDENGNPTTKDQAHSVEIIEYNKNGKAIYSTFGYINPKE